MDKTIYLKTYTMFIITLLGYALGIYTLVHMWKRLDVKTIIKVLIALAVLIIPFGSFIFIIAWWAYYFTKKPQVLEKYIKTQTEEETQTIDAESTVPPRKEFFLTRWLRQLVNWIDISYFSSNEEWVSPFSSLCKVFATCFITGLFWWGNQAVTGEHNNFSLIVEIITGLIMLIILVFYIKDDLNRFNTTGMKIARVFYIFFLFAISAAIGLMMSGLVVLIFILYLLLSFLWMMIFRISVLKL